RPQWKRLGFVVDTRDRVHLHQTTEIVEQLREEGVEIQIVFLEADDDILVRRFSETRRRHPLEQNKTVREGIQKEREQLDSIRARADLVVNTTQHTVHTLKALLQEHFSNTNAPTFTITVLSFGFKHGLPIEC